MHARRQLLRAAPCAGLPRSRLRFATNQPTCCMVPVTHQRSLRWKACLGLFAAADCCWHPGCVQVRKTLLAARQEGKRKGKRKGKGEGKASWLSALDGLRDYADGEPLLPCSLAMLCCACLGAAGTALAPAHLFFLVYCLAAACLASCARCLPARLPA